VSNPEFNGSPPQRRDVPAVPDMNQSDFDAGDGETRHGVEQCIDTFVHLLDRTDTYKLRDSPPLVDGPRLGSESLWR
jgi:hypothetical protein